MVARTNLRGCRIRFHQRVDNTCNPANESVVNSVGQEALESSFAVLQTAAKPSQLPARIS